MKTILSLILLLVPAYAMGQRCVECPAALVSIPSELAITVPVQTVEYQPVIVERQQTVRYVPARYQAGFNFVPSCAVEAAQAFQTCRANGGRPLGCLLDSALVYLTCDGVITRMRHRVRARRIARGW